MSNPPLSPLLVNSFCTADTLLVLLVVTSADCHGDYGTCFFGKGAKIAPLRNTAGAVHRVFAYERLMMQLRNTPAIYKLHVACLCKRVITISTSYTVAMSIQLSFPVLPIPAKGYCALLFPSLRRNNAKGNLRCSVFVSTLIASSQYSSLL